METISNGVKYLGSRGIRNNNPGNIEKSKTTVWQGQSPAAEQTDPRFLKFVSADYGIRALTRVLDNYKKLHKITTIQGIIERWAPGKDGNNVAAYVAAVSRGVGKGANVPLDFSADMPKLVAAIIKHENGTQPYSTELIQRGIFMARG